MDTPDVKEGGVDPASCCRLKQCGQSFQDLLHPAAIVVFTHYLRFLGSDLLFMFCFRSCVRSEGLYILNCDWNIRYCMSNQQTVRAWQHHNHCLLGYCNLPAWQFDAPSNEHMLSPTLHKEHVPRIGFQRCKLVCNMAVSMLPSKPPFRQAALNT